MSWPPPVPATPRRASLRRRLVDARRRATSTLIRRHRAEFQMLLAAELDRVFDLYPPDLGDFRPPADGF